MRKICNRIKRIHKREDGAITVEFATALPVIVVFLLICVSIGMFGIKEIQCVNASGIIARNIAMGKPENDSIIIGKKIVGNDSDVVISKNNDIVEVSVKTSLSIFSLGQKVIEYKSFAYKEPM